MAKKKENIEEQEIIPEPISILSGLDEIKRDLIIRSKKGIVKYGIEILDDCVDFIRPSTVTIIAACPNTGKSMLAQNIACNIAKQGEKVLICSCEMSAGQLMERQLRQMMNLSMSQMSNMYEHSPSLIDEQFEVMFSYDFLQNIKYLDIGGMHVDTLLKVLDNNKEYKYVIIDYLQRIKGNGSDKYEMVSDASYKLQIYALQHEVSMITCSQISKKVEINARGEKKGIDFTSMTPKGAGEIEEDAHVLIKMAEDYKEGHKNILINLAKNKCGEIKLVTYRYKIDSKLNFVLLDKDV